MSKVAIIGAGMGGLMAGNLLAKKGHEVTIFEAHTAPGGYTAGFRQQGYYFESGTLSFESSHVVFPAMKELGLLDKVPFVRQHSRLVTRDFECNMYKVEDLKAAMYAAYPSERENLDRYWTDVEKMRMLYGALAKPRNFVDKISFPLTMLSFMRMFRKYEKMTITEFTARYFDRGTPLYQLLKDFGYPDMSASIVPAAFMAFIEDYWTVKTGMQSWADVLAENFKQLGGELRLNARVEKILTRNGAVASVICGNREHPADYVLSACDYKKTFLNMLGDKMLLPQGFTEKLRAAAVSEGFVTVYLGLNICSAKLQEYMKLPHVTYFDHRPDCNIYNAADENFFEKTSLWLYSTSMLHEKNAPDGKSSLMIQTPAPYRWMNNWGNGDREVYRRLKDKAKRAMIRKAAVIIPGIEKHIEFEDAATPLTYERYTGNTDGATSAWSWNPNKWYYSDAYKVRVKTPVKNLLITSCWAHEMGGIPTTFEAAERCTSIVQRNPKF
ncbi:NAD(P)/FAD-dependent oxidoreductase [candidate division WOR-3 bacterium]|nr:NAD(P)/FAD-dependent oxidoreductase [candidate division WOR-3 bacterium]